MKKWYWMIQGILAIAVVLGVATQVIAHKLVTNEPDDRPALEETPADYGMVHEEVTVITEDGLALVGWFIPSENGATLIAQHGYKGNRQDVLPEAAVLHRQGYAVLITTVRGHDQSDGEVLTFGMHEMKDLEAWYRYLLTRDDVDPTMIGMYGESMGAALSIQYASQNENIRAVIAHSPFSSLDEVVSNSLQHYTHLPPFPFSPMIMFWAERESGMDTSEADTKRYIQAMCGRPVFILHGGADTQIDEQSGQLLYEAACQPKQLWFEPEARHVGLFELDAAKFETKVVAFLDEYMLDESPQVQLASSW
jgi:esterase/lipase